MSKEFDLNKTINDVSSKLMDTIKPYVGNEGSASDKEASKDADTKKEDASDKESSSDSDKKEDAAKE